jgi:hypothetical protein
MGLRQSGRFWQSGKILAIWQDFGNLTRPWPWQPGKIYIGINTCIRQSGKILAIWQDFGNQAIFWLSVKQISQNILLNTT